ncbi:LuxR C-terminal-related transcriptional regulator [Actinoplanes sp. NPDC049316]|uniref:LuxR C-terminal-related transcriptional regulator n=1 Tax=Actinoplanes sp. NPDC049316 TaxID=3154727 RepID=UPI00342145F4
MITDPGSVVVERPRPIEDSRFPATKFVPPDAPPFMVARPLLIDRVARGVRGPITVITGPAGSGKTQLVASWRASLRHPAPVAWLSLDGDDRQRGTLWMSVVEALSKASPSLAGKLTVPPASAGVDRAALGRIAAALRQEREPVVLVLDGMSWLDEAEPASDLDFVLRHSERRLRLIVTGRWNPPLPLHRYRIEGALCEIRSTDLAFSAEDAGKLMVLHGITLSEHGLAVLLERTEGWAAGLRLFACACQDRSDPEEFLATLSGEESTIAEYFMGEVLRLQAPEVRRFLLQTSVLGTFTPELAAAVAGRTDAHRLLADLARVNAFVQSVGTETPAYRYHRLFAELLHAQLTLDDPGAAQVLHRRAARFLADQGDTVEAMRHAAAAQDWELTCSIAVDDYAIGRLMTEGTAGRDGAPLRGLPQGAGGLEGAVVRAALALAESRRDSALREMAQAEHLLSRRGADCGDALTLACLLINIALLLPGPDTAQILSWIAVAETFLGVAPAESLRRRPELPAMLLSAKGAVLSRRGDIEAAAATLADAAGAEAPGCEYAQVEALQQWALLEAYRGRLGRAEALARRALERAAICGTQHRARPAGAELALAWVALEHYDIEAADRHLRAAHPDCVPGADGLLLSAYALVKSRRLQARGELRGALSTLRAVGGDGSAPSAPDWLAREVALAEARLLITAGRVPEAGTVLERFPEPRRPEVNVVVAALRLAAGDPAEASGIARAVAEDTGVSRPVAVEAWLLLATLAARDDDLTAARAALRQSLRCAAAENHRRTVYQVWPGLRQVVRDDEVLAEQYRALAGDDSAVRPRRAAPAGEAGSEPIVVEQLSRRELEVLQGMAEMLPTEEIAAAMYVSVNTVKTHVRSILRKLSASRRNEAVRRARALHLI